MEKEKEKKAYKLEAVEQTLRDILIKYPPDNEKNIAKAFQTLVDKFPEVVKFDIFKKHYKPNIKVESLIGAILKNTQKEIEKPLENTKKLKKTTKDGLAYLNKLLEFEEEEKHKEILKFLIKHVSKGFDLRVFNKKIDIIVNSCIEKTGSANLNLQLKDKDGIMDKYKAIKASFEHILNLKPVLEDFQLTEEINRKLKEIQERINEIKNKYAELLFYEAFLPELDKEIGGLSLFDYPENKELKLMVIMQVFPVSDIKKMLKVKPRKQSSHIFTKPINMLFSEFKKIYPEKTAIKETVRLLKMLYPDIFKNLTYKKLKERLKKQSRKQSRKSK